MITIQSDRPSQTWTFDLVPEDGGVRVEPRNLLRNAEGLQPTFWSVDSMRAFLKDGGELVISCMEGCLRLSAPTFGLIGVVRDRGVPGNEAQRCYETAPRSLLFALRDAAGTEPTALLGSA